MIDGLGGIKLVQCKGGLHWFGLNDRMPVIRALGMQGGFAMLLEGDF